MRVCRKVARDAAEETRKVERRGVQNIQRTRQGEKISPVDPWPQDHGYQGNARDECVEEFLSRRFLRRRSAPDRDDYHANENKGREDLHVDEHALHILFDGLIGQTLPGGADEGGGDDFHHQFANGGRDVAVHIDVLALAVHGDAEEGHPSQRETRAGGVQGKHVAEGEMLVPLGIDDEEAGREVAEEDEPRGEDPGPPDATAALLAETPAARLVGDGAAPGDGEAEGDDEGGDAKGDEGIVGGRALVDVAGPHHPFEGDGGRVVGVVAARVDALVRGEHGSVDAGAGAGGRGGGEADAAGVAGAAGAGADDHRGHGVACCCCALKVVVREE